MSHFILQTCRDLFAAGNEHIVWMNALRNICLRYGVFAATFEPMTDMSLRELKHAATSPMRLLSCLRRVKHKGLAAPLCTRILVGTVRTRIHSRVLVPGGRFLFTVANTEICLWDLGYTPNSIINPYPIA